MFGILEVMDLWQFLVLCYFLNLVSVDFVQGHCTDISSLWCLCSLLII